MNQKTVINQLANNGIKVFAIATSTQLVDIPEKVDEELKMENIGLRMLVVLALNILDFKLVMDLLNR